MRFSFLFKKCSKWGIKKVFLPAHLYFYLFYDDSQLVEMIICASASFHFNWKYCSDHDDVTSDEVFTNFTTLRILRLFTTPGQIQKIF